MPEATASLFNTIYNPDVLSCIANLSNDEVFTPPDVANAMLDMLPQELFSDPNTRFLDPACKSGVFLREIAKRLLIGLEPLFPDLQERVDHIYKEQLFGIAITELTSLLSRRSLYCSKYPNSKYSVSKFEDVQGNVRFKNTSHRWVDEKCVFCGISKSNKLAQHGRGEELESHAYEIIHTTHPGEIFNMKFDVVIGNPPYQLATAGDDNGAQARPIYQRFVQQAIKLDAKYVVMITPSRWFAGGWGLDDFRNQMMESNHLREIHDFPISTDCFTGVQIKGGVSYFLYDRQYKGDCLFCTHNESGISSKMLRSLKEEKCEVIIRDNKLISIYHKVQNNLPNFKPFGDLVSGRSPFGFNTNHHGSTKKIDNDVPYYERSGYTYMPRDLIKKGEEYINTWKIYISKAYGAGEGYPHQIINKPILGEFGTICSGTYLMIGPFATRKIAENVIGYMCSKFFRALVAINKISQDASYKVYEAVPQMDFSQEWTDDKLYSFFNLSQEEIDYIETIIRPMDLNGGEDDA